MTLSFSKKDFAEIKRRQDEISDELKAGKKAVIKAILEVREVNIPSTFIIVPQKLESTNSTLQLRDADFISLIQKKQYITALKYVLQEKQKYETKKFQSVMRDIQKTPDRGSKFEKLLLYAGLGAHANATLLHMLNDNDDFFKDPVQHVKNVISGLFEQLRKKLSSTTCYFYLIDELNHHPVEGGPYPLEIRHSSSHLKELFKFFCLEITSIRIMDTIASIGGMPLKLPQNVKEKMDKKLEEFDTESLVTRGFMVRKESFSSSYVEENFKAADSFRATKSRAIDVLLRSEDKNRHYAGLCLVFDRTSGKSIWTTEKARMEILCAPTNST